MLGRAARQGCCWHLLLTFSALDHIDIVRNATHTDVVAHTDTSVAANDVLDQSIENWAKRTREGKVMRVGSWVVMMPVYRTNEFARVE